MTSKKTEPSARKSGRACVRYLCRKCRICGSLTETSRLLESVSLGSGVTTPPLPAPQKVNRLRRLVYRVPARGGRKAACGLRLPKKLRGTRLALQLRSTSDSRVAAARQRHDGHETTASLPGARSANIGRSDMPRRTAPAGCPLEPLPLGSTDSHHRSES